MIRRESQRKGIKVMTKLVITRSKSIPANVKRLREEKGLGHITPINLTPDLQRDIDSLSDERIDELWADYEEFLKEG